MVSSILNVTLRRHALINTACFKWSINEVEAKQAEKKLSTNIYLQKIRNEQS